MSQAQKTDLNQRIVRLTADQLSVVVEIVRECSPEAFAERENEQYQIFLDRVNVECYLDLDRFIDKCLKMGSDTNIA